jgi:ribosome biogenesis GTPase
LERYLTLAKEAGVTPVVVLTKADLVGSTKPFIKDAEKLLPNLIVEAVDAREIASISCLHSWCSECQTVAFVGSSGVGKSTLINTLLGTNKINTQGIREDDDKGRHTTTGRALYRIPEGGWLLDTPGMRELQMVDVDSGLNEVFLDIISLASQCRFANCEHNEEPDCAVQVAIRNGDLDPRRLKNWRKLLAEQTYNSESMAQRRQRGREFSKMVKRAKNAKGPKLT